MSGSATGTSSAPQPATPGGRGLRRAAAARGPLTRWRTVDLVTAAMLGVAFGVVFWGWDVLYALLKGIFAVFPPSGAVVAGVWLLPAVVGALVIRRPGAALLTELVAATLEAVLGNQWGVSVIVSGVLQGVGVEVAFAVFAWRAFGPAVASLGGVLAAVLECQYEWSAYYPDWSWAFKLAYLGAFALSGVVITGVGGSALVRALARTGALSAFPPGTERRAQLAG